MPNSPSPAIFGRKYNRLFGESDHGLRRTDFDKRKSGIQLSNLCPWSFCSSHSGFPHSKNWLWTLVHKSPVPCGELGCVTGNIYGNIWHFWPLYKFAERCIWENGSWWNTEWNLAAIKSLQNLNCEVFAQLCWRVVLLDKLAKHGFAYLATWKLDNLLYPPINAFPQLRRYVFPLQPRRNQTPVQLPNSLFSLQSESEQSLAPNYNISGWSVSWSWIWWSSKWWWLALVVYSGLIGTWSGQRIESKNKDGTGRNRR